MSRAALQLEISPLSQVALVRVTVCGEIATDVDALNKAVDTVNSVAPAYICTVVDKFVRLGTIIAVSGDSQQLVNDRLQLALQIIRKSFRGDITSEKFSSDECITFESLQTFGGRAVVQPMTSQCSNSIEAPLVSLKLICQLHPEVAMQILSAWIANVSPLQSCTAMATGAHAVFSPGSLVCPPDSVGTSCVMRTHLNVTTDSIQLVVHMEKWRMRHANRDASDFCARAASGSSQKEEAGSSPPLAGTCSVLAARRVAYCASSEDPRPVEVSLVDSYVWPSLVPATVRGIETTGNDGSSEPTVAVDLHLGSTGSRLYTDILGDFYSRQCHVPTSYLVLSAAPLRSKSTEAQAASIELLCGALSRLPFIKKASLVPHIEGSAGSHASAAATSSKAGVAKLPVVDLPAEPVPVPASDAAAARNMWPAPTNTLNDAALEHLSPAIWLKLGLPVDPAEGTAVGASASSAASAASGVKADKTGAARPFEHIQAAARLLLSSVYRQAGAAGAVEPDDPLAGVADQELERLQREAERRRRLHERKKFAERFKAAKASFVAGKQYTTHRKEAEQEAKKEGIHVHAQASARPSAATDTEHVDATDEAEEWALVLGKPRRLGNKRKRQHVVPKSHKAGPRQAIARQSKHQPRVHGDAAAVDGMPASKHRRVSAASIKGAAPRAGARAASSGAGTSLTAPGDRRAQKAPPVRAAAVAQGGKGRPMKALGRASQSAVAAAARQHPRSNLAGLDSGSDSSLSSDSDDSLDFSDDDD